MAVPTFFSSTGWDHHNGTSQRLCSVNSVFFIFIKLLPMDIALANFPWTATSLYFFSIILSIMSCLIMLKILYHSCFALGKG